MPNNIARTLVIIITGIFSGFLIRDRTMTQAAEPHIIKSCTGHLTGSSEFDRVILIEPVKGILDSNYIVIFHLHGTQQVQLWKSPPSPVWDIFLADIDGDNRDKLAVCLYKTEPYDPIKDNRLHIYSWRDDDIHALWRGTFLSKPFENIMFGDVSGNKTKELISIERGRKTPDKIFLSVYCWNGFGFDLYSETGIDALADAMKVSSDTHEILMSINNDQITFHLSGNTIVRGGQ